MTRAMIDLYSANHVSLASKIIDLTTMKDENIISNKILAREIAAREYSEEVVKEKWSLLMQKLGV